MIQGLAKYPDVEIIILATKDQLTKEGEIPGNNSLAGFKARRLPLSWHIAYFLWLFTGLPYMDKYAKDLDWVYCPKNDFIPLKKVKTAITIHGAHEIDPDYPKDKSIKGRLTQIKSRLSYKRICKQSTILLTVSNFLKEQMIKWFNVSANKIVVTGNGIESVFFVNKGENKINKQLITVGGLNYLDGGDRIIKLAEYMTKIKSEYYILVVGNQHEELLLKKAQSLPNIRIAGYKPTKELAEIMQDSYALLFLTRYETFGITAIEAMASGLPVITCNSTAVPEIVGDAAIYVNPDKIVDIYTKIERLDNIEYRKSFIVKGYKKSKSYTWDSCVLKLKEVLT